MFHARGVFSGSLASKPLRRTCVQLHLKTFSSSASSADVLSVPERAYLKLTGKDTKKFLQGVTTNDMDLLKARGDCLATVFLTPKGRVLSDALIYDITEATAEPDAVLEPAVLVETHASTHTAVAQFLSMYRLRAKVKIHTAVHYRTDVALQAEAAEGGATQAGEELVASVADPRHACLGRRLLYSTPSSSAVDADTHTQEDIDGYTRYRMLQGLAEGAELEGRVPLEANLDLLGYISFTKGCYVGQELVARTKHKGMVRKRFLPFLRTSVDAKEAADFALLDPLVKRAMRSVKPTSVSHGGRRQEGVVKGTAMALLGGEEAGAGAGEVVGVSAAGDLGICKVALKDVFGGRSFAAVSEAGASLPVRLFKPQWWPEKDPVTGKRLDDPSTH